MSKTTLLRTVHNPRHTARQHDYRKAAFTLAEVLITLAVIGVVAALTVPVLINNYQKSIVQTRIKKFYSVMNQAIQMSEIDNGPKENWWPIAECSSEGNDSKACEEAFFKKYLQPYLKYVKYDFVRSNDLDSVNFLRVYFADGSVMKLRYGGHDYVFYPIAKLEATGKSERCKTDFTFAFYPTGANSYRNKIYKGKSLLPYISSDWDGTTEGLYTCENGCTRILQLNGWEFSGANRYPWWE